MHPLTIKEQKILSKMIRDEFDNIDLKSLFGIDNAKELIELARKLDLIDFAEELEDDLKTELL